jgi:hypothetical protein
VLLPSDTYRKPINVHYSRFTSICELFTDSPSYKFDFLGVGEKPSVTGSEFFRFRILLSAVLSFRCLLTENYVIRYIILCVVYEVNCSCDFHLGNNYYKYLLFVVMLLHTLIAIEGV